MPLPQRPSAAPTSGNPATATPDAASHARLFLALWPTPAENVALRQYQQRWTWPMGSSPVKADRLHLTLHFIGDVERQRIAAVGAGLRFDLRPFVLAFTAAAIWPRGLVVLPATEVPDELAELHARLAEALRTLALPVESRRFRPHLTLARRAANAVPPVEAPALTWRVDGYLLVESALGAGGGYRIRQRYG